MDHPTIYYSGDVLKVRALHQAILATPHTTVFDRLAALAENLYRSLKLNLPGGCVEIRNHHPQFLGSSDQKILSVDFSEADCRLTIARSCGFENWEVVQALRYKTIDREFEQAVDLLINGKYHALKSLLIQSPYLIHQHSDYGHHAGLIHYVAANGIEIWRQYVPSNIVSMTRLLLHFGADTQMRSNIYGGTFSLNQLLQTSSHPWKAGVGASLAALLNS